MTHDMGTAMPIDVLLMQEFVHTDLLHNYSSSSQSIRLPYKVPIKLQSYYSVYCLTQTRYYTVTHTVVYSATPQ